MSKFVAGALVFCTTIFAQEIDLNSQFNDEQDSEILLFEEEDYLQSDEIALEDELVQGADEEFFEEEASQ